MSRFAAWIGGRRALPLFAALLMLGAGQAAAQERPTACIRLETQLANLDAGRLKVDLDADARRFERSLVEQERELALATDRLAAMRCNAGFLFLGPARSPQCDALESRIGRMRANRERLLGELARARNGGDPRAERRRRLIAALAQNDCGPQYRNAAVQTPTQAPPRRGLFDMLFGGGTEVPPAAVETDPTVSEVPRATLFKTVCVRQCDGFFFPISQTAVRAKFALDQRMCTALCPNTEATLYVMPVNGDIEQATSVDGQPYTAMPNAMRYRQTFDKTCACRAPGQSWADALANVPDDLNRGDILVDEERAKLMSLPADQRPASPPPPGRRARTAPPPAQPARVEAPPPSPSDAPEIVPESEPIRPMIRQVGPSPAPGR